MSLNNTILLINPPGKEMYIRDIFHSFSSKGRYLWQPTDLVFLSARLKNDFNLEVIDAIANKKSSDKLIEELFHKPYHTIIGLTGSISFKSDIEFFQKLVKTTQSPLILIGDLIRYNYKEILEKYSFVSGLIDDFTSEDILPYLKNNQTVTKPKGMVVRIDGMIPDRIIPPKKGSINIPIPRHDLFPMNSYRHPNNRYSPMATVLGSTGCPYPCGYCSQSTRKYRYRDAKNILKEIDYLQQRGIKEILFRDQLMEAIPRNFVALLEGIIERGYKLGWTCNSRVDTLKPEWLPLMKKAGCHSILFGVENPSQKILDQWETKKNNLRVKELFQKARDNGIAPCAYFILGLPGETKKDVLRTIDFAIELNPSLASFSLPSPDFGTKLRVIAIEKGILKNNLENSDRSIDAAELNDDIQPGDLRQLRSKAFKRFYFRFSFLTSSVLSIRSWTQFRYYADEFFHMLKEQLLSK